MESVVIRNLKIGEGRPKICVPLTGTDMIEIREEARRVLSLPADMIEWRADYFRDVKDPGALTACLRELRDVLGDLPLLFTLRSEAEGGAFGGSGRQYAEIVGTAASSGLADMVDVELARCETSADIISSAHERGVRVVASYHDFDATPAKDKLIEVFCSMQSHDADILKIAVMPQNFKDVLTLMEATEEASRLHVDRPVVGISMGSLGIISRAAAESFRSAICFAAGPEGGSAPGQIAAEDMREILRIMHNHSGD